VHVLRGDGALSSGPGPGLRPVLNQLLLDAQESNRSHGTEAAHFGLAVECWLLDDRGDLIGLVLMSFQLVRAVSTRLLSFFVCFSNYFNVSRAYGERDRAISSTPLTLSLPVLPDPERI
jgi:hypothetical protein